jgi:hypothetical protein
MKYPIKPPIRFNIISSTSNTLPIYNCVNSTETDANKIKQVLSILLSLAKNLPTKYPYGKKSNILPITFLINKSPKELYLVISLNGIKLLVPDALESDEVTIWNKHKQ